LDQSTKRPPQTNSIHIFLANDLHSIGPPRLDISEDIESTFMTSAEIKKAIAEGKFSQAMHIASFYMSMDALDSGPKNTR
jgi:ADP-ribose pyrophosphatase